MPKKIALILILNLWVLHAQPRYVTTIHPFQQILQEVVGDHGGVEAIVPPGASPHTYEIRPSKMRHVAQSIALFYGAKDLDAWATRFPNSHQIELLTLVPDSLKLALTFEAGHEYHEGHIHDSGIDPHFWTDPLAVKAMLPGLVQVLAKLDPAGRVNYEKNAKIFGEKLDEIYLEITRELTDVQGKAVMLSQPFFRYFFYRFQIKLVDVLEKIPGKEPTPRELKGLIEAVQKHQVKAIFNHAQLPDRAAQLVAEASGVPVRELDPLGGSPGRISYFDLLRFNAKILREALNE